MATSPHNERNPAFKDIREFGRFVKSLWGFLATTSLLFPFANLLTRSLPYPNAQSGPPSTAFASIASGFMFLSTYIARELVAKFDDPGLRVPRALGYGKFPFAPHRSTLLSAFVFALLALLLTGYLATMWDAGFGTQPGQPSPVAGLLEYSGVFALATLSFSLLATSEYMRQTAKARGEGARRWPELEDALNALYLRLPRKAQSDFKGFTVLSESRGLDNAEPFLEVTVRYEYGQYAFEWYRIRLDSSRSVRAFAKISDPG